MKAKNYSNQMTDTRAPQNPNTVKIRPLVSAIPNGYLSSTFFFLPSVLAPSPMDSPSPKHRLFLLLLLLCLASPKPTSTATAAAYSTSFNFATSSLQNLTLIGDAYLLNTSIGLTQPTSVPSTSSGAAACNFPVDLSAYFSTNFSFSTSPPVTNDMNLAGDGLNFFVASTLSGNGILGSEQNSEIRNGSKRVWVVEFGLGGDGGVKVVREETAPVQLLNKTDAGGLGVDFNSGKVITSWIEYDNFEKVLGVWLSYSGAVKPKTPVVMASLDFFFDEVRDDSMFVGLSATTEGTTITHVIHNWYFQTYGFSDVSSPNTTTASSANPSGVSTWSTSAVISNSDENRQKNLHLHLAICGLISLSLLFTFAMWILIKKKIISDQNHPKVLAAASGKIAALKSPRKFAYKELSIATRGFHASQIIGTGSFGTVYRGLTPGTSTNYAVKRSKHHHSRHSDSNHNHNNHRHQEFLSELSIIGRLRHKNLVNLLGWCVEDSELILVYELMPNGSLDTLLYSHNSRRRPLPWHQRYKIATGVAEAVAYLHSECEQQVIHRDIKTSNIMLDSDFNPRLGDFGLAKLIDHDTTQSPVSTLTAGTLGYLAPEYIQYGIATGKTDVFSFGVVALEICCGRLPISKPDDGDGGCLVNLVDWVWRSYREDNLVGVADSGLNGEFESGELSRLLLIGLSCANPDCGQRPDMRQVVRILKGEAQMTIMPPRVKPCLMFSDSLPRSLKDILSDGEDAGSTHHNDEA